MTYKKKPNGHQLGPMTHFFTTPKFDLLLYIGEKCLRTHLQSFLCVSWLTTPPKKVYRHQLQPMLHFLRNQKFDLLSYFYIINFLNLPLRALIHDLQKKNLRASTRTHDPFFDNSEIWPTFIYRGEVPAHTFAKLPVLALINDPKKLFQKKVYVTIPQWFETFPNVSHLRSGRNRAKCGLVLNDPIDWFKLRLNQPKNHVHFQFDKFHMNSLTRIICNYQSNTAMDPGFHKQEGGGDNLLFGQICHENCMKMKKIESSGLRPPPLRSANETYYHLKQELVRQRKMIS